MIIDKGKTLKSWQNAAFSWHMPGTLATGDYLGDTAAGTGLGLPAGEVVQVHYAAGTASGSGTTVTIHNVTKGASASFTPDSSAGAADVSVPFDDGDELAIEVAGVDGTTAGADVSVALDYEQDFISST